MHRAGPSTATATVLALALSMTGCTRGVGGDDATGQIELPDATGAVATTTPHSAPASTPPTTAPLPRLDPGRCEDDPDPADHPVGTTPLVLRPCTLPAALEVDEIHAGSGRAAEAGDTLFVDYTGIRSATGEMFDTSYLRGMPLDFVLGRGGVIRGWDEGLLGVQAGEVVKLDVPADMAYGDTPPGDAIEPGDALTFLVEVRAVIAPVDPTDAPLDLLKDPSTGATQVAWRDATIGDGAAVEQGTTAVVHVLLARGDTLDVLLDTWSRNDPLQVPISEHGTLPGIVAGLVGARVGGTRLIVIPPADAFGPDGEAGLGLPADVDLIVVAQVLGVF